MRKADSFLKDRQQSSDVEGRLIGTLALKRSQNEIQRLKQELEERGPTTKWDVCDLSQLLSRSLEAHNDFIEIHEATAD